MRVLVRVGLLVLGSGMATCLIGLVLLTNPVAKGRSLSYTVDVDPEDLRRHVEALIGAGEAREWRNREALARTAGYIKATWEGLGLEVETQSFEAEGESFANLIVRLGPNGPAPSRSSEGSIIVVGAHYDVCGEQPGADDNASGVAAVLELARLLQRHRPALEHEVEIVAYTLEEPPFFRTQSMGSMVHARSLVEGGVDVEAMIALDLIGYYSEEPGSQSFPVSLMGLVYPTTGDFVCVVSDLRSWSLTRRVKALMAGGSTVPVESINAPASIAGVDFSDHLSYWAHGYEAVLITDTAFFRNPHYHEPGDTLETLDLVRMAEVVKGLYRTVVGL